MHDFSVDELMHRLRQHSAERSGALTTRPNVCTCGKPCASADTELPELLLAHFTRLARVKRCLKGGVDGLTILSVRSALRRQEAA